MSNSQSRLKIGLLAGVKKGWSSFIWVAKIIIPIALFITLIQWSGWLSYIDFLLRPIMGLIDLPGEAALPVIIGGLTGSIYSVAAVLAIIPFTIEQMTLIAVFSLIAHGLIAEGIFQHKSGMNAFKIAAIRITAAVLATLFVSRFLGGTSQSVALPADLVAQAPLLEILKVWALDILNLLLKILGILMFVMILLETSKSMGWVEHVLKLLRPVMNIFGLSDRTAMMWAAAAIFGLIYCGAVIVEESKKTDFTKDELERLHISIGISHSVIEDPIIFMVLGINPLWLYIPRLVIAILAVQAYRFITFIQDKLFHH